MGTNAAKHPEILKRMDAEGHVIGNHSYAHQNLTKGAAAAMQDQVNKCAAIIRGAVGYDPVLLRPPGGNYDNRLLGYAKEKGVSVVNWTVDTRDWEHRNKDTILATAFRQGKYGVQDGAIVLMHDVYETSVDAAVGDDGSPYRPGLHHGYGARAHPSKRRRPAGRALLLQRRPFQG